MNPAPSIIAPVVESPRHAEPRATRALVPLADTEATQRRAGHAPYRHVDAARERGFERRGPDRAIVIEPARASRAFLDPGFAAQHIAQEMLSPGLHLENFRPALAAYSAADTNFATVRRPPPSSVVIWA